MTTDSQESIWIETDVSGSILDWSAAALPFVGYSARGIRGRVLPIMLIENRPRSADLAAVSLGAALERDSMLRPHDRRGVAVRFSVEVADTEWKRQESAVLRWTFTRRD